MTGLMTMTVNGFVALPDPNRARWYGGGLLVFLTTGAETKGQFALFEALVPGGEEVPFHTHAREDESFYILDGEITCRIGEATLRAKAGQFLFLPRTVRHSWRAESATLRFLVLITPAGFEQSFLEFSEPAPTLTLPPVSGEGPPREWLDRLIKRENDLGVVYDFQREDGAAAL